VARSITIWYFLSIIDVITIASYIRWDATYNRGQFRYVFTYISPDFFQSKCKVNVIDDTCLFQMLRF
jgi:hypothetical protein